MSDQYKLQVKIGASEFFAEGPEQKVREDFDKFISVVSATKETTPATPPAAPPGSNAGLTGLDRSLLERAFTASGEDLSLRLLPPEGPNRISDAVVMLLYGFKALQAVQDVSVMRLNNGLRVSGLSVERLDRYASTFNQFVMKGGTRSGGRYTLNNQGVAQAETLLRQYFGS